MIVGLRVYTLQAAANILGCFRKWPKIDRIFVFSDAPFYDHIRILYVVTSAQRLADGRVPRIARSPRRTPARRIRPKK